MLIKENKRLLNVKVIELHIVHTGCHRQSE